MSDRVRIYSRGGICLCDLRVTARRSWSTSGGGQADFEIDIYDANCRVDYFRFGNWLLIENDQLEPWVGMIDVPRQPLRRAVRITAYTPEHIFMYRNVPREQPFKGPSGVIFRKLLHLVNYAEETILQEGEIWEEGLHLPDETLTGDHLLDMLTDLDERTIGEYSFTPVADSGRLVIFANWKKTVGVRHNFTLEESYNLSDEDSALTIQSEFVNELWGYGNGAGQNDRPAAVVRNKDSIAYYGLRQGSRVYSNYKTVGPVRNALRGEINMVSWPHDVYKLAALDVGGTWSNLRCGHSYPFRSWSIEEGISDFIRVIGMFYDPARGKVDLTFREDVDASRE